MATGGAPIRVLLVDDDPDLVAVTSLHLERQDDVFDTQVAHAAAEALDLFDGDVDCVVSDYEMPGQDGLDLLREVRDYDATRPFVLFTGRGSEEIANEAISAGFTDYLQKGTVTDQYAVLANRLKNAVARRRSAAVAAETESRYQSLVESSPHAVFVHDGDSVRYANERLAALVGAAGAGALRDFDPAEFVHPGDSEAIGNRAEQVITDGEATSWTDWRLRRLNGEIRRVESRGAPVEFEGVRASQVVIRDVTDQYRRERRLEALHDATRRLLLATDHEAVGTATVDVLEDVFDAPIAAVWEYLPEHESLAPLAISEGATQLALDAGLEPKVSTLPDWTVEMSVFESGQPRDVQEYGDRDDVVSDAFEAAFFYPLEDHGLIAIASTDPRTFDDAGRELVSVLARSVTAASDRTGPA